MPSFLNEGFLLVPLIYRSWSLYIPLLEKVPQNCCSTLLLKVFHSAFMGNIWPALSILILSGLCTCNAPWFPAIFFASLPLSILGQEKEIEIRHLIRQDLESDFSLMIEILVQKNLTRKSIIENLKSASIPDDRYAVSNGSGYAKLISLNEYTVLDKKLDTPYPVEVDTPYSAID
ncbi:hypothetical protein Tco_1132853 [Tanacetum coccineum]|uniref:Uncharacterized protein n=1 Tax=Tanacetum coccineum TaxID=301880 RepID=A0ABQ5JFU5_9ASTR